MCLYSNLVVFVICFGWLIDGERLRCVWGLLENCCMKTLYIVWTEVGVGSTMRVSDQSVRIKIGNIPHQWQLAFSRHSTLE